MIRAALFDYGDTLISSSAKDEEIVRRAMFAAYSSLARAGLKNSYEEFVLIDKEVFRKYGQMEAEENRDIPDVIKYEELTGELFQSKSPAWTQRTAVQADAAFWDVVARYHSAREGAARSLGELRSMGVKMAVLSNHHSHSALVRHLEQLGLDRYFLRIFSSAKLGVRKPDSRAFTKVLEVLKVRPDEAVFVGDSVKHDIAGGRACGMKTILVRGEANLGEVSGADFTVRRLGEIPPIVRRLNGGKSGP